MVEARWSGEYPCLCRGEWTLKVNGKNVSDKIPDEIRKNSPMNTYGYYEEWNFDENWQVIYEGYHDGLNEEEWIEENDYWLSSITDNMKVKEEIYEAVQSEDFRQGTCGGCI